MMRYSTFRGIFRLSLTGALLFVIAVGCAKKKTSSKNDPAKTEKTQPLAKKADKKSPAIAENKVEVKKTGETPPEKKVAEKVEPKPKQPVAKAKKKSAELVPISKVTTAAQAEAHLKRLLNPEQIERNSLDEIRKLDFEASDVTDEDLALLRHFPYVSHINLAGTKITDAGLVHLKQLERLSELFLYNTKVTDTGVKHIAGLTRMEQLCLDKTQVTDKGIAELKGMVELWRLHLQSRNKTTDAVFATLVNMKRLTELHLHGTGFTADRVKSFRQQFPRCNVVWDPADPKKDEPDKPRKKGQVP